MSSTRSQQPIWEGRSEGRVGGWTDLAVIGSLRPCLLWRLRSSGCGGGSTGSVVSRYYMSMGLPVAPV